MNTNSIHSEISISDCCNAMTQSIPLTVHHVLNNLEPDSILCMHCRKECTRQWKPVWENVGKGTYRRIDYNLKSVNNG